VHWFEAAYRLVFVRAWLKKDIPMLIRPHLFSEKANSALKSLISFIFELI